MGRPLKIQKYSLATGDTVTNGVPVPLDQALPPFSALEVPVPPIGGGTNPPWLGVVGGLPSPATSAAYPVVAVTVNIALPSGAGFGVAAGAIVRQKGARKYMVADTSAAVLATAFVVGASYLIVSLGSTNWQAIGASPTFAVGDTFTCNAVGTGNGTAYLVGTCVLVDSAAPAPGEMNITFTNTDSTAQSISKLTNRFLYDFTGGEPGGNSNTGDVWNPDDVQQNVRYDANFFTDEGYEIKSGTTGQANTVTQQNQLSLGIVDNYT
jgi:hypothetical protein